MMAEENTPSTLKDHLEVLLQFAEAEIEIMGGQDGYNELAEAVEYFRTKTVIPLAD